MSTWDEHVAAEAERRDRRDSDWYALHAGELFRQGAAWQREQLLTGEAVEKVSEWLCQAEFFQGLEEHAKTCSRRDCRAPDGFRQDARAILTTLLGDQE